jgi:hypothetical protein
LLLLRPMLPRSSAETTSAATSQGTQRGQLVSEAPGGRGGPAPGER